ncbi:hypothetical protein TanjilG_03024 [Lupinus angustifolius]|uniref:Secreted protein n=1 Tax=Lupinus angustifolius TaxID=3871 RepID=A0A4P1RCH2_LUPAN|nr:hypothetical protein TanjilG_03024 [Lupinus angustifolius]
MPSFLSFPLLVRSVILIPILIAAPRCPNYPPPSTPSSPLLQRKPPHSKKRKFPISLLRPKPKP